MDNEQKYIWSYLDYFTEKERTSEYIKSKMSSQNFKIYYSKVMDAINENNIPNLEKPDLITEEFLDQQSEEVVYSIKQAREYFDMAEKVSLNIKPLIIYYGMISLSKALLDSSLFFQDKQTKHGIVADKKGKQGEPYHSAQISSNGFFPRFAACYSYNIGRNIGKSGIYYYEEILKLISSKDYINFKDLIYSLRFSIDNNYLSKTKDKFTIVFGEYDPPFHIDPISSYFISMYLLSNLVRYRPAEWSKLIMGSRNKLDWILKDVIEISCTDYPYFILNEFKKYWPDLGEEWDWGLGI